MADTMYVPSNIDNCGFGGTGNGFGFGRGNGDGLASTGDVQRGFDTNEITRKLDGLSYGLSNGFYSQNTNMLNGFAGVNSAIANEGRAMQCQLNSVGTVKYSMSMAYNAGQSPFCGNPGCMV